MYNWLEGKTILITGITGSFGQAFARLLKDTPVRTVRGYSRDEHKQLDLAEKLQDDRFRFFLGDVRDISNLREAMRGVDYVIHAAALKQVQKAEVQPQECVKTNIYGSHNVVRAALDTNVDTVLLVSTDKAVYPINLYGSTKMVAERLIIASNAQRGDRRTKLCATRYGNVAGSRSTVVPLFFSLKHKRELPITDLNATRFWIRLPDAVEFVLKSLKVASEGYGGEIYVPRMPSVKITDVAKAIAGEEVALKVIGQRPGDKLHEVLITEDEAKRVCGRLGYPGEVIQPQNPIWPYAFTRVGGEKKQFSSDVNKFLTIPEIKNSIREWFDKYDVSEPDKVS